MGTLLDVQGKEHHAALDFGEGDLGSVAKLKDAQTGDLLADKEVAIEVPDFGFPEPVMSFAITPKSKGDEEKVATAIRRLAEEDPTLRLRRDQQTGEEILSGHEPDARRGRARAREAALRGRHRAPSAARPVPRDDPPRGACARPLQEADGWSRPVRRLPHRDHADGEIEYEFVDKIVGGVIPQGFRPAVDKGIQEAMHHGELAGAPVQGVRVQLVDGSYHTVDSSEMAFKIAGSMAWKEAYMNADPVLLEPIMELEVSVPDDAVGAVNGDLNSRRGRLQGMEPLGGMTQIKAEVPMAELLTYAQSLTSMTSGRGDYSMHFLRYEEVPTHVAQKIIEETKREREAAKA